MTSVEILRDSDRKIFAFRSRGHTGYAEEGKDIVCAGVSTLLQTAVLGLEEYLKLDPKVEQEKGFLQCHLERDIFLNREIDAVLETMVLGLKALEREYPEHLRVTEEVVNNVQV
ncbi:MAG: ribosomal-processing cysteine protease Prp [Candidatus Bipolaricaulota bacterium]|nr:ribosomal-processing cysteine protease Prp [Candidatus Bipolaricaulota bacterium]MDW8141360.1 ribosomal-processing cysteine protease Prp [Candidatus Bipolaricaulota bacterium]